MKPRRLLAFFALTACGAASSLERSEGDAGGVSSDGGAAVDANLGAQCRPSGAIGKWSPVANPGLGVTSLCGVNECDIWGGNAAPPALLPILQRWDGKSWGRPNDPPLPDGEPFPFAQLQSDGLGGCWALQHDWNGSQWSELPTAYLGSDGRRDTIGFISGRIDDAWGIGHIWGYGTVGGIYHWDGRVWTNYPWWNPHYTVTQLWTAAANDVWAVGNYAPHGADARFSHWDGISWSLIDIPAIAKTDGARFMHGSSPRDIWAVTGLGTAIHWDGAAWTVQPIPVDASDGSMLDGVGGIWSAAPDDAWAVASAAFSDHAQIFHWDGHAWALHTVLGSMLAAIWGANPKSIWVAGTSVFHYTGE